MFRKFLYTFLAIALFTRVSAQSKPREDSVLKLLDEVVVTATRTENKVSNIPLPIQVISAIPCLDSAATTAIFPVLVIYTTAVWRLL